MMRPLFACVALACAGVAGGAEPQTVRPAPDARKTAVAPAPLGRLFFTPAERAQLDVARLKKPAPSPAQPAAPGAEVAEAPPPPQVVTYGGIIRRSDGKSMLWINNRLVDEKEALGGSTLKGRVRPDGSVTLQVPDSPGTVDVKVGQSVELQSGRVAEGRRAQPEQKPRAEEPADAKTDSKAPAASTQAPKPPESAAERKPEASPPAAAAKAEPGRAPEAARK